MDHQKYRNVTEMESEYRTISACVFSNTLQIAAQQEHFDGKNLGHDFNIVRRIKQDTKDLPANTTEAFITTIFRFIFLSGARIACAVRNTVSTWLIR
jgi:hypothetical protein